MGLVGYALEAGTLESVNDDGFLGATTWDNPVGARYVDGHKSGDLFNDLWASSGTIVGEHPSGGDRTDFLRATNFMLDVKNGIPLVLDTAATLQSITIMCFVSCTAADAAPENFDIVQSGSVTSTANKATGQPDVEVWPPAGQPYRYTGVWSDPGVDPGATIANITDADGLLDPTLGVQIQISTTGAINTIYCDWIAMIIQTDEKVDPPVAASGSQNIWPMIFGHQRQIAKHGRGHR